MPRSVGHQKPNEGPKGVFIAWCTKGGYTKQIFTFSLKYVWLNFCGSVSLHTSVAPYTWFRTNAAIHLRAAKPWPPAVVIPIEVDSFIQGEMWPESGKLLFSFWLICIHEIVKPLNCVYEDYIQQLTVHLHFYGEKSQSPVSWLDYWPSWNEHLVLQRIDLLHIQWYC